MNKTYNNLINISSLLLIIFMLLSSLNNAQENDANNKGKFSGYMIGDYYYNIQHHNKELQDKNGFWFRRIYFTYDYKIDNSFSSRLRLEMNNDGKYTSSETMVPFVKDAYLTYNYKQQKIIFGISSPPTFNLIEKIWGYRSIEKTPLDLQRMASSRDFGLAAKGTLNSNGKLKYHVMFGNGSGNKQEIDKGKSFMTSISYWFTKELVFEAYGDYADRPKNADAYIAQGFIGYKSKKVGAGLQYTAQTLKAKNDSTNDINLNLLSFFITGKLNNKITLIGRIDKMFNPNPDGDKIAYTPFDNSANSLLFISAIDISLAKDVSIIPNLEYVMYNKNDIGITPGNDIYAKLTFFWRFK